MATIEEIKKTLSEVFDYYRELEYKSENELNECSEQTLATLTLAAEIHELRKEINKIGPSQDAEGQ